MSHVYIRLDFGTDEEKAQLARHKLDGWKQAFRLDKKLLYKLSRPGARRRTTKAGAAENQPLKTKGKTKDKSPIPAQSQFRHCSKFARALMLSRTKNCRNSAGLRAFRRRNLSKALPQR